LAARVIEYRQLAYIISMFMIVQFLGLALASQIYSGVTYEMVTGAQVSTGYIGSLFYIAFVIVFSVFIVLIFRWYKGDAVYKILDAAVVISASFVFFLVIVSSFSGSAFNALFGEGVPIQIFILSAVLAVALAVAKMIMPRLRNVTAMVASVGVGVLLGVSFGFFAAMTFMVVLAVYDFVAVFVTKHMIALGNMAVTKNLSMMIMASEYKAVPVSSFDREEKAEYLKSKKEIERQGRPFKSLISEDMVPVAARTALGTGDLAVPLMIAVSAYKVYLNFTLSLVVVLGSILGLVITMLVLKRYRKALPAIPFLLFGIAVALGAFALASSL
jgi:presenilin-like A22 family membrane protease